MINYVLCGTLWNNAEIEIITNGNRFFALDCWNGEKWCLCWELADKQGFEVVDEHKYYEVIPIYEPSTDEDDDYNIIGYEVL